MTTQGFQRFPYQRIHKHLDNNVGETGGLKVGVLYITFGNVYLEDSFMTTMHEQTSRNQASVSSLVITFTIKMLQNQNATKVLFAFDTVFHYAAQVVLNLGSSCTEC